MTSFPSFTVVLVFFVVVVVIVAIVVVVVVDAVVVSSVRVERNFSKIFIFNRMPVKSFSKKEIAICTMFVR